MTVTPPPPPRVQGSIWDWIGGFYQAISEMTAPVADECSDPECQAARHDINNILGIDSNSERYLAGRRLVLGEPTSGAQPNTGVVIPPSKAIGEMAQGATRLTAWVLNNASRAADKQGLTRAGFELKKHASRSTNTGQWPTPTGKKNAPAWNSLGDQVVTSITRDPRAAVQVYTNKAGDRVVEYLLPDKGLQFRQPGGTGSWTLHSFREMG
ncbi:MULTISPECIES: hypothetical protein [unclassified Nonomuraea]|uniref:hypothetical protein n=1 Tax=unclassified Nonomuraea TaxID=2593643 RepID=UPI0033C728F0